MNLRRTCLLSWIGRHQVSLDGVVYDSGLYELVETDRAARSQALSDLLFLMSTGAVRLLTHPCRWVTA